MARPTTADDPLISPSSGGKASLPRVRSWARSALPIAPLLVIGVCLGPQGLNLFTLPVLAAIDPAVPVALAAIGCRLGLSLERRPRARGARALAIAATGHGIVTVTVVALGLSALSGLGSTPATPAWLLPIVAGLCAASSLTLPRRGPADLRRRADAIVDLEAIGGLILGAGVLAATRTSSWQTTASTLAQSVSIITLVAGAGWLFVTHTTRPTEGRVFAIGTALLVGGMADYLTFSPLLGGLAAGALWQRLGGPSRETLHREVLYAQHPLVVLVLLVAGARAEVAPTTLGLAAGYAGLRLVARLACHAATRRLAPAAAAGAGLPLLDPGIVGVAFVLTVLRAVGTGETVPALAVSVVVLGTILAVGVAHVGPRAGDDQ
ncbi:MAG: hypothetical protein AB7N65_11090 [Vicinamibacterales bacterium]